MRYSQMSDQEINQEVTCILSPDAQKMAMIGDGSCFYDCGPDGNGFYEIPVLDYCNNPADAWPIIISNRIAIVPASNSDKWAANHGDWDIFTKDSNPLRAAMIVFLTMQDSE